MPLEKASIYTVKTNKIVKFPDLQKYIEVPPDKNHLHFLTAFFMDKYGSDTKININIWKNEVFLDKMVKLKEQPAEVKKAPVKYGKQDDGSYKFKLEGIEIEEEEKEEQQGSNTAPKGDINV